MPQTAQTSRAVDGDSPQIAASSVIRALNLIGDRWTLLLVYLVFLGHHRFQSLAQQTGMGRGVLSGRLKFLQENGLLVRRCYCEAPKRYDYHLTDMGRDLADVALAIIGWDKTWHYDSQCVTHHVRHSDCGKMFTPTSCCADCGERVTARDVRWETGPGQGMEDRPAGDRTRKSSGPGKHAPAHTIIERSAEILGDRWTALVIAAAFYRIRRFAEFERYLGIAPNILSSRLSRLTEIGILQRHGGVRAEYRLTEEGLSIFPIIATLMRWGDRWLAQDSGPPVVLFHRGCGARLTLQMRCDQCDQPLKFGSFVLPQE